MKHLLLLLIGLWPTWGLWAQRGEVEELKFLDLSAFQPQAGNWKIVGAVWMNPTVDIHEKPAPPPPPVQTSNKRKHRRKRTSAALPPPPPPKAVVYEAGTGILLNMNNDSLKDNLLTNWEHGDVILDLEVMLPKGSNSGIYLQGRYEVQLYDSWGKQDPSYSDIGGIYRNWEKEPGKIYAGKAPLVNAARAPGLWQRLRIGFRAPRFDRQGHKTENARFVFVELNGVRIHDNVEVPLPTGGPVSKEEVPMGPLMVQGDHGPVAFRNLNVQHLAEGNLTIEDLRYRQFPGDFQSADELVAQTPATAGPLPELTGRVGAEEDAFGVLYQGNIKAPAAGAYSLRLNYQGGVQLTVGDQVIEGPYSRRGNVRFTVDLQAGDNPFELTYLRRNARWPIHLGLFDLGSFPKALHAFDSYPPAPRGGSPIYLEVGNKPRMLRAFLDFRGDRNQRLTHTIGVGGTNGSHYVYDLKTGSIACVWRGDFVDATPMWNSRGDGSFRPRGDVRYLFRGLSLARIENERSPFPSAMDERDGFQNKGYRIDRSSGLPVFLYGLDTLTVADAIMPDDSGNALTRTITLIQGSADAGLYMKLAEGSEIRELPGGIFSIDQQYYIRPAAGVQTQIRELAGLRELIAPVTEHQLEYTIMW